MSSILKYVLPHTFLGIFFFLYAASAAHSDTYAIVTSSDFKAGTETLGKLTARTARHALKREDSFIVYNGSKRDLLMDVKIPDKNRFANPGIRLSEVRKKFKPVVRYMKKEQRITPTNDNNILGTLRAFADNVLSSKLDKPVRVLVYADVLHHDIRETDTSMRGNIYPNDGHLTVDIHQSPFGTIGRENAYQNVDMHLCYATQFTNRLHQENIHRFYALYFKRQGGHLATFSDDITTCQSRFLNGDKSSRRFTINPDNEEPIMIRIERQDASQHSDANTQIDPAPTASVEKPQEILTYEQGGRFLESGIPINRNIPDHLKARVKVGIRWSCDCDFDLHVKHPDDTAPLNYNQTRNSLGRFFKDWRGSPDAAKAYEYIEFFRPIDVRKLDIKVNFYSGRTSGAVTGTLRIWIEGQSGVWEVPFTIRSRHGKSIAYDERSPYWVTIDPWSSRDLSHQEG